MTSSGSKETDADISHPFIEVSSVIKTYQNLSQPSLVVVYVVVMKFYFTSFYVPYQIIQRTSVCGVIQTTKLNTAVLTKFQ